MFEHLDWNDIRIRYEASKGHSVIIDDFLPANTAEDVHAELLSNQMWRIKNPISKHLYNSQPHTSSLTQIIPELQAVIAQTFNSTYQLSDFWAMLYSKNTDGNVHADFGDLTLTYWLTQDKYNKCSDTGGLVLYDVKRPYDMPLTQYLSSGKASEAYVDAHTAGAITVIPYRFNRSILFNPTIFHKSNRPQFDLSALSHMRMNLTFAFDDPAESQKQLDMIA